MTIPERIPGRKLAVGLLILFGAVWISLEGQVRWSAAMALLTVVTASLFLLQRLMGGRQLRAIQGAVIFAALGVAAGLWFTPAALLFMTIKTGLHGHGPEFSQAEILWIVQRTPLWAAAGLMAGLGLGLLIVGFRSPQGSD